MAKTQVEETRKPVRFRLRESLMETEDINLLERILKASEDFSHANITQYAPMWAGFVELSNDNEPIGKYLPGGRIIRRRYTIAEIQNRYNELTKNR